MVLASLITAYDGEAGLRTARSGSPDLILLDVMLPKMIGFDVCRLLREEGNNVHRPHVVPHIIIVPDLFHQIGPGIHLPRMSGKERQQLVLPLGQGNGLPRPYPGGA